MSLFFPAHDIALGYGIRHYTPAPQIRRLQDDLAWLQQIWNDPAVQHDAMPLPWGWNWDTREFLVRSMHIGRENLPTDAQLSALRELSNRRTSIALLNALGFSGQMPEYLDSVEKLSAFVAREDAVGHSFVLKSPWSSSGRGLIRSAVTPRDVMMRQASAVIKGMGGIVGERWFDKEQDFAMLFRVGHSRVHFLGYSLFDNAENCTYRCGYLLSNQQIEEKIRVAGLPVLAERLRCALDDIFRPFFGLSWQVGYVGVDMMRLAPSAMNPDLSVHPCVELNLRCTMGVVARLWSDLHLKDGQQGRFEISPMDATGHFHAQFVVD
ncbi:MAG: hypothetical protein E7070_08715 [Bacteroidales bacterium]|jgi:hypothetical protein|nr:hypothetical protein [Bacteroidales bacterium]